MAKATGTIDFSAVPASSSEIKINDGQSNGGFSEVIFYLAGTQGGGGEAYSGSLGGWSGNTNASSIVNLYTDYTANKGFFRIAWHIGGGATGLNSEFKKMATGGATPLIYEFGDADGNFVNITLVNESSGFVVNVSGASYSRKDSAGNYSINVNNAAVDADNMAEEIKDILAAADTAGEINISTPTRENTYWLQFSSQDAGDSPMTFRIKRASGSWTSTDTPAATVTKSTTSTAASNIRAKLFAPEEVVYAQRHAETGGSGALSTAAFANYFARMLNGLPLQISASVSDSTVSLTNDNDGTEGNVTITTVGTTNATISGMSGGAAAGGGPAVAKRLKISAKQIALSGSGGLSGSADSKSLLQLDLSGSLVALGTSPASSDLLVVHDLDAGVPKKVTVSELIGSLAGGQDTQFQYNNGGSELSGSVDFVYNDSTGDVTLGAQTGDSKLIFRDSNSYIYSNEANDLTVFATDVNVDAGGAIKLDSDSGDISFEDGGVAQLAIDMDGSAGEIVMQLKVDSDDFVFKQYDGTEVFRVEDDGSFDIAGGAGSSGVTVSAAGQLTADGRIIVDDATEATSTTDGSIQTDGGLSVAKSAVIGDDLDLLSDAAILNFGADKDVNLTHVADTGLLLNSSMQLQFGDSGTYIYQSADGVLDLVSDNEVEINGTSIDINGAVDMSSTLNVASNVTIGGDLVVQGDTVTMDVTNLHVEDIIIGMGVSGSGAAYTEGAAGDRGLIMHIASETNPAMFWDESEDEFAFVRTNSSASATTISADAYANLHVADLEAAAATLSSTLSVTGLISGSGGIDIAGSADFGAALNVQGAASLSSTLDVVGLISGSGGLDIAGSADFGAAVNVQGAASLSSTLDVVGLISGSGGLDIAGSADFGAAVNVQGAASLSSTLDVVGLISGSGGMDIAGQVDLGGALNVQGAASLSSTLDVVGLISGSGGLDIAGAADFGAAVNVQGAASLSSTLDVTGLISGSGGMDLAGQADFGGAVNIQGLLKPDGATDAAFDASKSLFFRDSDGSMKRDSFSDIMATAAGAGIQDSAGVLSILSRQEVYIMTASVDISGSGPLVMSDAPATTGSVMVFFNGLLQTQGTDYTLGGAGNTVVSLAGANTLGIDDEVVIKYIKS